MQTVSTRARWLWIAALAAFCGSSAVAGINGVLRTNTVSGANTRYFTDDSGKPIYLTGAHTWANVQDGLLSDGKDQDPPPAFDFAGYLDYLAAQHENFARYWMTELPKAAYGSTPGSYYYPTPLPWARTGPGIANDGKAKFDLTVFNQAYFDRLRARAMAAGDRGIYVSIMLFEGYGVRVETNALGWAYSPFNAGNNINNINGDPNGNGCGIESHTLMNTNITALQEAYIEKVIDTVNDLDNVLFEVSNEEGNLAGGTTTRDWEYHVMQHIREYEAGKPKQHPVMLSCIYNQNNNTGNNTWLTDSTADCIAPWGPGNAPAPLTDNPPATTGSKVVFADTDHIYGVGGGYDWVWKVFMRGYNPIFMDDWGSGNVASPTYNHDTANAAMGATRLYADRMNLAAMPPQNGLASTTYCLASAGSEYLVYQPSAGNITLYGLIAGNYTAEWTHPDSGAYGSSASVALGAGAQILAPPFTPAVLYLKIVATNQVATPVIAPAGASFYGSTPVTLTCGTAGAAIRYTLDGSEPATNSTLYNGTFDLSASATLKAKGFKNGLLDSNTIGANFYKQSSAGTIVDDNFNDGNLGTNGGGTGSGWNSGSFNGAPLPTESAGAFHASMGTENGIGAIQGKDIFTFWDGNGMTATWVIQDITVQTPHAFNAYLAYCWEMGVISANNSNAGSTWNMSQVNTKGGFYVSVGKKDNSNAVEMWVAVSSKNYSGAEGSPGFIRLPAQVGSVLGPRWTATFPLTVTATLTSNGWSVTAGGLATPISGNWTSSLISGTNNASISDEFNNGAFLFTAGRNHGIDGSGHTFTPNSGSMDRVTVIRNSGNTVSTPVFTPAAGTYFADQDVTISSATGGAGFRYTTDGSAPTTNSGALYTGSVHIAATTTLKAIATKDGMDPSAVASGTYILLNGPGADSLVNGSFEDGSNGWIVTSSDANPAAYGVITNQGFTDGPHALALGNANAKGNAVFLQNVKTAAGSNYTFRFDYGAFGAAAKPQQLLVELLAGGSVFTSRVVTANGPGNSLPGSTTFQPVTIDFVAPSTSTVFRFTDQTSTANSLNCDGMLDHVTLSGAGAGGLGIRLACIGDSITEGAYPGLLRALLGEAYLVENDGVGGKTMIKNDPYSYWSGGRLAQVQAFGPALVTIMLGTNDSKLQNWASRSAEFKADYLAMIDWLNALPTRPRIFVVKPVPAWTNSYGINPVTLQSILAIIAEVAAERNLPLIDANTPFLGSQELFPDGVHPNAEGAADLAEIFHEAITNDQATPVADWPTFSPAAGTYGVAQNVTISTTTGGASIRFTLDGSTPSQTNGTPYTVPVHIATNATLKAMAYKGGMTDSAVNSGNYVIDNGVPTEALVNGSFENGTNGWTVSSSDANPPKYGIAGDEGKSDGLNALKLGNVNNFAGNTVFAQKVATLPGGTYLMQFDYGAFGNGSVAQSLRAEALDGTNVLASLDVSATVAAPGGNFNPANVVFTARSNSFTAVSAATTIRFTDRTTLANGNNCDGVLDNVRVSGPPAGASHAAKGTPVAWLEDHGLVGDYDQRELEDPDKDGMKTWEEYVAGTDPLVRESCFTAALEWASGMPVVSFSGLMATGAQYLLMDRYYEVQRTTNLLTGVWQPIPGYTAILGQGGMISYTNPTPQLVELYRVRARLQAQ